jgi:radical SAM superfamily enzyme YgiQ (UPF0313 family)
MKVLIISSNTLSASPSGPVYLAGAVRQAGHDVQIFERLFAVDLAHELSKKLKEFDPDVVGISIRLVFGDELDPNAPLGTHHTDLRPRVKEIVDIIRQNSSTKIVLGGPGFNYYARDWLEYLDLDYGIRGEGEEAFPLYLKHLSDGGDTYSVPGCIYMKNDQFDSVSPCPVNNLDDQALPAFDLLDWQKYSERHITPAILTKRGCAFTCTYCPYSKLEGKLYRLKSPERVLAEANNIFQNTGSRKAMFCDNNFNAPRQHAESIMRALIADNAGLLWGTGDLRPVGVTNDFCRLMEESGCFYANLSIESASETILKRMKRGYSIQNVRDSLESLSRSKIPFGASLMIGAPGETPETIAETLRVMDDYEIPNGVWVTIGVYMWTDLQDIVSEALQTGLLKNKNELFNGAVYLSPGLPGSYLKDLPDVLRARQGYSVQFNKPSEAWFL